MTQTASTPALNFRLQTLLDSTVSVSDTYWLDTEDGDTGFVLESGLVAVSDGPTRWVVDADELETAIERLEAGERAPHGEAYQSLCDWTSPVAGHPANFGF